MDYNKNKVETFYMHPNELAESALQRKIPGILDDFNTKIDCSGIDTWCTEYISLYGLGD